MQIISTKLHALIDYLMGAMMVLIPIIFFKNDDSISLNIIMGCGAFIIFYNSITRFEYSIYKFISIRTNRRLDILVAVILLGSAWAEMYKGEFAELNCYLE